MKNLVKVGMLALAFGFIFISVDTVSAQRWGRNREARREYRDDIRDARQDYRRRASQGNYRKAQREYREDIRDARRDYRRSNRNTMSRGQWNNRRIYRSNNRYYSPIRVYRRW